MDDVSTNEGDDMTNTEIAAENCEGGCGAKVFGVKPASGRPQLREVAKHGSVEHTADRCRELRVKATAKAAEKAEAKNVVRHLQRYTSEQRANRAASHRMGHQQRHTIGEYFYTHPAIPNRAFDTRGAAARAALALKVA